MAEAHIGLLFKAAAAASTIDNNKTSQILRSYYMMRCLETTKGIGLPKKYFAKDSRCPRCGIEWSRDTETKLRTVKLSKKQRRRIRIRNKKNILNARNKESILHSNELEQICTFCHHSMKTLIVKQEKPNVKMPEVTKTEVEPAKTSNIKKKGTKNEDKTLHQSNVYCKSKVAFNLKTHKNNLTSTVKTLPKIIKNNKKKKDKFAGLCQKAVIAAAKLKQNSDKQNKLNLFLKSAQSSD